MKKLFDKIVYFFRSKKVKDNMSARKVIYSPDSVVFTNEQIKKDLTPPAPPRKK